MAEVADADLAVLQNAYALLKEMQADPKAKRDFERAIKAVRPQVETEADVADRIAAPYVEQIKALEDKITARFSEEDTRRAARAEADQERSVSDAFTRLSEQGYTEDGLDKIKALMIDRRIPDPEAAAALFDKQNPKPPSDTPSWEPNYWSNDPNLAVNTKELFEDSERWADKEVGKVLHEMRKGG